LIFGLSFDDEIFILALVAVLGDQLSLGMVLQILLRRVDLWIFSHGCCEEYYPRNICLGCYVLDNGDSCSRFSNDVDQAVRLLFPDIIVLVLLPMVIDYRHGCARARSLGITALIKIMREPSLVFSGLWFGIYLRLVRLISIVIEPNSSIMPLDCALIGGARSFMDGGPVAALYIGLGGRPARLTRLIVRRCLHQHSYRSRVSMSQREAPLPPLPPHTHAHAHVVAHG
jgi:hypothetical protein